MFFLYDKVNEQKKIYTFLLKMFWIHKLESSGFSLELCWTLNFLKTIIGMDPVWRLICIRIQLEV